MYILSATVFSLCFASGLAAPTQHTRRSFSQKTLGVKAVDKVLVDIAISDVEMFGGEINAPVTAISIVPQSLSLDVQDADKIRIELSPESFSVAKVDEDCGGAFEIKRDRNEEAEDPKNKNMAVFRKEAGGAWSVTCYSITPDETPDEESEENKDSGNDSEEKPDENKDESDEKPEENKDDSEEKPEDNKDDSEERPEENKDDSDEKPEENKEFEVASEEKPEDSKDSEESSETSSSEEVSVEEVEEESASIEEGPKRKCHSRKRRSLVVVRTADAQRSVRSSVAVSEFELEIV